MILSSTAILAARLASPNELNIAPYSDEQLNPASYDLTLGDELLVYCHDGVDRSREGRVVVSGRNLPSAGFALDSRRNNPTYQARVTNAEGLQVMPGRVYLMATRERIRLGLSLVGVVDGKSSIGRLGLVVHATAGYVDPGFDGHITLEIAALGEPVIIYPGMRIAQLRLMRLEGELDESEGYQTKGHYVGARATGPVASCSYLQFSTAPKTEPAPPPEHVCPSCDGQGDNCALCSNRGHVASRPFGVCEQCGGTGRAHGGPCLAC